MRPLILPFLSLLFNKSLTSGLFPTDFKNAVVCPRLKKEWLDASQLKNYRPVLNLSFLSNLLERVVQVKTSGLSGWWWHAVMLGATQSAYRQFHSTESAVLKVYNDLLLAADSGLVSALWLLDLTAAFNTVDHDLLLSNVLSVGLAFVVPYSSGSDPTSLIGLSESCLALVLHF